MCTRRSTRPTGCAAPWQTAWQTGLQGGLGGGASRVEPLAGVHERGHGRQVVTDVGTRQALK